MHIQSIRIYFVCLNCRSVRDEGDERLPLRDAVETRPISLIEPESSFKIVEVKNVKTKVGLEYNLVQTYLMN